MLGAIDESAAGAVASARGDRSAAKAPLPAKPEPAPAARAAPGEQRHLRRHAGEPGSAQADGRSRASQPGDVVGTGRRGQVLKGDVAAAMKLEPQAAAGSTAP